MSSELYKSLLLTWLILSTMALLVIIIVVLDRNQVIYHHIPLCSAKLNHQTCILCGSSGAYYAMTRGDIATAFHLNTIAVWIFVATIINALMLGLNKSKIYQYLKK